MQIRHTEYKKVCTDRSKNLSLNVCAFSHICRYHKYPNRREYGNTTLGPGGLCIDLFHSAYPFCLALLYGGKFKERLIISCPNPEAKISIVLKKKPTLTKPIRKIFGELLTYFSKRKVEVPDTEIILEIEEASKEHCAYDYKKGDKFKFNIWQGRELCPATFDVIYPTLHNITRGGNVPWASSKYDRKVVCPDPASNITLDINSDEK